VPTIWLGMLQTYEAQPGRWRWPANLRTLVGGAAVPESLIRAYARHGVRDLRIVGEKGIAPWDGKQVGEIQVRGPFITGRYHASDDASRFSDDGWLRTGDVGAVDEHGYVRITDRTKDLIKSGGEWISSVDLENAIMAHPAVAEAAVIAIPHEKWGERPLACVVLKPGRQTTPQELNRLLAQRFAKWQLPDRYDFIAEIPRTSTGKFWKAKLRSRYR
jgi:fatty-acyl-CoA synthase